MVLFDFVFYALLFFTGIGSYKIIRSAPAQNKFIKLLKLLWVLWTASLWIGLILQWVLPKGSKYQEAVHLPRHLWILDHGSFKDGYSKQKIAYGQHPKQYYHYYPGLETSPKKNTIIIYFHGGGWCLGSPDQHRYLAHLLQQEGYSLVFPAYRLTPAFGYKDLQADVNHAVRHALNFVKQQGVEQPKIILGGTSAGGNLASLFAYDENRWSAMDLDRSILKGVFSIVGALNTAAMEQTYTLLNYTGLIDSPSYQLANPLHWISPQDTFPFLCLHGKKDGLVAYKAVEEFCKKLNHTVPNMLQFKTYETATHIELGAAWYYNSEANLGQDTVLINWLNTVSR
ncbi:alpha/beta hydrolase [Aureispira sp. CCB-QB1]|uniref:alpha/beta hydrolase n=1 Tax=Aureispira sp. CCB-QB1 TaxID=1313421 RepID=UPI00069646D4|nr:alpha/beta hydrolase [Aureispira sp. CCB-QB1]